MEAYSVPADGLAAADPEPVPASSPPVKAILPM